MLDLSFIPDSSRANIQVFNANSVASGVSWQVWNKPRGCSFVNIFLLGGGGGGGAGFVGAASAAGGGGGGGSSAQTILTFPAHLIPDILFISVGVGGAGGSAAAGAAGINSFVSLNPISSIANYLFAQATGGGLGGLGLVTPAGGPAGGAGAISTLAATCLAGLSLGLNSTTAANINIAGQAGIIGGAAVAGGAQTLPVTGLVVTGGTGGGGLGAANVAGKDGGAFTVPTTTGVGPFIFPPAPGGVGGTTAPTAGGAGTNGCQPISKLAFFYGGTGGASCGLSVTPTGANGGTGGNGAFGCGGGGGGAAFTGNTAGLGGRGGDGICIITAW